MNARAPAREGNAGIADIGTDIHNCYPVKSLFMIR